MQAITNLHPKMSKVNRRGIYLGMLLSYFKDLGFSKGGSPESFSET
jgi:hypothetical protein